MDQQASLTSVAGERDDALSLLSSVTTGIFSLLGATENASRLLGGMDSLIGLLQHASTRSGDKLGGGDRDDDDDEEPCAQWARFLRYSRSVLAGLVALRRQLEGHGRWVDPELLHAASAAAACPSPPQPPAEPEQRRPSRLETAVAAAGASSAEAEALQAQVGESLTIEHLGGTAVLQNGLSLLVPP